MLAKILLLDNLDSFTYNLVDFFRQLGCQVKVYRNTVDPEVLATEAFDLLVLSPGPSVPRNAGNMMQVIAKFYQTKPILGVCLGHQALIEFFGGTLENIAPVHGKSVPIQHDSRGIFTGLEQDCKVARYHSWAGHSIPSDLEVSARSHDGAVMAVRHKRLPIEGIQFHPESVLSMQNSTGMRMLRNVIEGRLSAGNRIYHELSKKLQAGVPLDTTLIRDFLQAVEEGQLSDDQKQILLVSLSHHLREAGALKAFTEALFQPESPNSTNSTSSTNSTLYPFLAHKTALSTTQNAVDICGTGGSGLPRINTSTLASLLLAHGGLPIAKHGNRAAAGRFGSFNLLESLGVPLDFDLKKARKSLDTTNLAFLFAPAIHPVFRHFAPIRAKIGVPTIFNVLGPLVNPCLPERQFIGTAFADLMDLIFETGIRMGKTHLIVVRGWDGLDEISVSAPTRVLEYHNGKKEEYEICPEDFGIETLPFQAVSSPNPEISLSIARKMLSGLPDTEHYKLVAINAAFIYTKFVEPIPLPEAYHKMEKLILDGVMGEVLDAYKSAVLPAPLIPA
ncbi:MAG: anthranilate phosphoribosyltransferase [Bacteroidota bacterium]